MSVSEWSASFKAMAKGEGRERQGKGKERQGRLNADDVDGGKQIEKGGQPLFRLDWKGLDGTLVGIGKQGGAGRGMCGLSGPVTG